MAERLLRTFHDAVAIVTGGASGIGRSLSEELAGRGAFVVLADRQIELAQEIAAAINDAGGKATASELDVRDAAAVKELIEATARSQGRLDYLFNNAGVAAGGEALWHELEDWNTVLDVNLRGVIHGVHAAYPIMVEQGFGHIVNTASMAGLTTFAGTIAYSTSKYAIVGLSTSLRVEAASYGVRVSVICPGVVRTPILEGGKFGRMLRPLPQAVQQALWRRLRPMDVGRFARQALRSVARNQAVIILPRRWKIFWWLHRLSPSLSMWLARRGFVSLQKAFRNQPNS